MPETEKNKPSVSVSTQPTKSKQPTKPPKEEDLGLKSKSVEEDLDTGLFDNDSDSDSDEEVPDNALVKVMKNISKSLKHKKISTKNMISSTLALSPTVQKIIQKSNLIDSSWNEIIKAKAIVDPSHYIADRARAIKNANTKIAIETDLYLKGLNKDKNNILPDNKIKALLERKILTSAIDHYEEINAKYPINNLAASLQNAITSSTMNPTASVSKSLKRKSK